MLAREAPVSAVSLAEKKAETNRQPMTIERVSQSNLFHPDGVKRQRSRFGQFGLEKITHQGRLDIVGDHRAADRLEQDEG